MKDAVALGRDGQVVLGPHIGDLAHIETRTAFTRSVEAMRVLYGVGPGPVACDAHPDYHTTRAAAAMGTTVCPVPHHPAHILSAVVERSEDRRGGKECVGTCQSGGSPHH